MGTRSAIGYLTEDGDTEAVYCHWDGYPENQLPILNKHYVTTDAVKALIAPGSMSCLRTDRTWDSEITRTPRPLYHAERGDPLSEVKPIKSSNPLDLWFKEYDCEYLYVWDGTKWIHYSEYWPEGRHMLMVD